MNQNNPYQSSVVNPTPQSNQQAGSNSLVATQVAQQSMMNAKGWVRLISVVSYIYFAIILGGGLYLMAMASYLGGGFGAFVFLIMLVIAIVVFMLALRLSNYASAISRLAITSHPIDLESAMVAQMRFWRLAAIISIIYAVIDLIQTLNEL